MLLLIYNMGFYNFLSSKKSCPISILGQLFYAYILEPCNTHRIARYHDFFIRRNH
jgi:hypothetical protein